MIALAPVPLSLKTSCTTVMVEDIVRERGETEKTGGWT